ncbi:YdeI/OmpD-associated family protein [Herbiconiux daphne]|uniref:YdeI/OmpD-associated family protein n=1 Tax=Herbiconiux daphne TaxID=2970914 RepID=A0ABT2GX62_9MICO|nr:YdeI/OmpD-associated family protein [Herbiconiux daphne]MCS5732544.1 YdeI/OmpD-associated family protein [Herbiconiux daphne]
MADDYEHLRFGDAAEFEAWLEQNAGTCDGVRLKIAKKGSSDTTVSHLEALDVALCHGWIDGRRNALDDDYFLQTFTPRRSRSLWSQVNRDKVAALTEAGRMREGGQREIDRAKADGRWDAAYASSSTIEVPSDLADALRANPEAESFFTTLTSQNRYAILFRVHNAKRADTRARRIADFVAMLARHETVYPQSPPKP